jgi:putative spermidine/putrescine transport system ATP-binding protein
MTEVRPAGLLIDHVSKDLGGRTIVSDMQLEVHAGELTCLLGPSGCGKTTTLRMIGGFLLPDAGRILIDGADVSTLPPERRPTAMVFQNYALWPHMTVFKNVAFGLKLRKLPKKEIHERVENVLELVGLTHHIHSYPARISGGEQQRVALARSLVLEPKVLLLDEPLSALDAKVRSRLRDEIRRVQLEVGITTLFVTHDQEEALAIADRVGVMQAGRLEQLGPPTEIYSRPATPFVAEFVGLTNRLQGQVRGGAVEVFGARLPLVDPEAADGPAIALVRPEAVSVDSDGAGQAGPLVGTVIAVAFLGAVSRVTVDLDGTTVLAQMPTSATGDIPAGTRVRLTLRPDPVLIQREEATAVRA